MKNFKLLCLFLVGILFVSTVVIGGRVVEGYYGGSGGDLGMEPIFIICICIGVVVAVISCICIFLYCFRVIKKDKLIQTVYHFQGNQLQLYQ